MDAGACCFVLLNVKWAWGWATKDLTWLQKVAQVRASCMVTEGFIDISALKRNLHYILLGNLGKDMGLEFRSGVLVATSKS